jgi:hypothetical protein
MKRLLLVPVLAAALLALSAAPALASPKTFYVHPSGGDDTANIQGAFNAAVKAGPGSTVLLSAGHFYTNRIVVRNFDGTFRGASVGRTTIDCLRGLNPDLPGVIVKAEPDINAFPYLVCFDGGNVRVSEMSFDITPASPVDPQANGGSDVLQTMVFVTGNASSAWNHVGFTAGEGSDYGYNTDECLIIAGYAPLDQNGNALDITRISGTENVCGCSFAGHDGLQVQGLTAGRLTVIGNAFDDGILDCVVDDSSASQIAVSDNQMHCTLWASVILYQGFEADGGAGAPLPSLPAPRFLISDNHILATGQAAGVQVQDESSLYSAPSRLDATIAANTIVLDNGGADGGIDGIYGQGIKVLYNRISGTGLAGIDVGCYASLFGLPSGPDSGWQIIGNDVSGLTATGDQYGISTAPIWLGPDADHCLVIGGKATTQVLDQGTNDTLINVTKLPLSSAARARGAAASLGQPRQLRGELP